MLRIGNRKIQILIICIVLLMITSCSKQTTGTAVNVTETDKLTIWAWDETYNIKALEIAIDKYVQVYPSAEIEIVTMSQEETVAKLSSALLTDNKEALPDIVLIEDYRIQSFLQEYESYFVDLSDLASPDDFAPYKTSVNQVGDNLYGIPFDSGVVGLFYRLDYIEAAGYTEEDMANLTWEEYIEIGKVVKEKTGRYMLTLNPNDLPMIRMILQSQHSWYTDEMGQLDISDNKILAAAIQVYVDILNSGIAKPITDWDQFIRSFQNGDTATVISGSWISSSILKMQEQSGLWRVAELPALDETSRGNASSVGGSGWYVMNGTGHEEEAKQFLYETFVTNLDLVNELIDEINLVSSLKKANTCTNNQKGVEFYGNEKIFQSFYIWTNMIPTVNYGNATYEIEQYVAAAIQKVLAGSSIEEALKDCEYAYNKD